MRRKKIYILIGQKGSGKTFIGGLFERNFQITFLRVEDWAKTVKRDRRFDDETYLREVFAAIENGVREALIDRDAVVFESTGLTEHFDEMLRNLKSDFDVTTIKVITDRDLCVSRVKSRDQSIHINVSDKEIELINSAVLRRNLPTDFEIENADKSIDTLKAEIGAITKKSDTGGE